MSMKLLISKLTLVGILTILFPVSAGKKMKSISQKSKCIMTWKTERHANPWAGLTNNYEQEEKSRVVPAMNIPFNSENTIKRVDKLIDTNDYILMRLPNESQVTVNAKYFSTLKRIDVTRLIINETDEIGIATPSALEKFSPREILDLLLSYQILITYAHLEANLCLVSDKTAGDEYTAEISGKHIYFTNRKNESSFSFTFSLNTSTAKMKVLAAK